MVKTLNGLLQSFAWGANFAIICNWFPRKGRGVIIAIWATCPNVGDIVGSDLYLAIAQNKENWGYAFMVLAILVAFVGLLNLLFLVEYPKQVGVDISEF